MTSFAELKAGDLVQTKGCDDPVRVVVSNEQRICLRHEGTGREISFYPAEFDPADFEIVKAEAAATK